MSPVLPVRLLNRARAVPGRPSRLEPGLLTGIVLLAAVPILALVYDDARTLILVPPIGFLLVIPHVRGAGVVVAAAVSLAGTAFAALEQTLLSHPAPSTTDPAATGVGVALAGGLLLVRSWQLHGSTNRATTRYAQLVADLPTGVLRTAPGGRILEVNDAFLRIVGDPARETLLAANVADLFVDPVDLAIMKRHLDGADQLVHETLLHRTGGSPAWVRIRTRVTRDPHGQPAWYDSAVEDIEAERAGREAREELARIVESAGDAVFSLELDGTVITWNESCERAYGWTAAEAVGTSLFELGPEEDHDGYRALMAQIAAGQRVGPIEGEWLVKGGAIAILSLVVFPIHDAAGGVARIAVIARDLTEQRRLEARLERWRSEREHVVRALRELTAGETAEATAAAVCVEIGRAGFGYAGILGYEADGRVSLLAFQARDASVPVPSCLSDAVRLGHLRERAADGPWVEEIGHDEASDYRRMMRAEGISALAYVPIVHAASQVGLLVVSAAGGDRRELVERLPGLIEFGAIASPLLAPLLVERYELARTRAELRALLDAHAFHPVFQPIVALDTGAVLGYEGLTRFDDGRPPTSLFAAARRVGLDRELESATLAAVLDEWARLGSGTLLNVNVSPDFVLDRHVLPELLARTTPGKVVLEITEQSPVSDYEGLRAALSALPEVRLAIDDAGAGFASFRHIVELRPAYIKIDRDLVAGLDLDPAREALVAGLVHFADRTGAILVAEGIETEAEREAVLHAGVRYGQGFLLGRPQERPLEPRGPVRLDAHRPGRARRSA